MGSLGVLDPPLRGSSWSASRAMLIRHIRTSVAEVQVNHKSHACSFDTLRQLQSVREVILPGRPDPHACCVPSVLDKDLFERLHDAVIREVHALLLDDKQRGDVRCSERQGACVLNACCESEDNGEDMTHNFTGTVASPMVQASYMTAFCLLQ